MKRLIVAIACGALLAACARDHNNRGQGSESGTYQGTTGSQGTMDTNNIGGPTGTSTNTFGPGTNSVPAQPQGGPGSDTGMGPGGTDTDTPDMDTPDIDSTPDTEPDTP